MATIKSFTSLEQNPIDKVETIFKVGDWVVCESAPRYTAFKIGDVVQISSKETLEIFLMFKDCFRPWTIQDAKCGDVVVDTSNGTIGIFQSIGHHPGGGSYNDPSYCFLHCRYDDGFFYADFEDGNTMDSYYVIPATKEQRDQLEKAMTDAGYTFDFEKKELRKLEPADKIGRKFKVGDIVQYITDSTDRRKIEEIDTLCNMYHTDSSPIMFEAEDEWKVVVNAEDVEQEPAWSEEDETIKNNISHIIRQYDKISKRENQPCWYVGDCLLWMQNIKNRVSPQPKQEWSKEDEVTLDSLVDYLLDTIKKMPAEEYAGGLGKAVVLLKSIKERVQPQSKQWWSDEDDQYLLICKNALTKYQTTDKWDAGIISRWLENKLKVHQSTWKPSDEQLEALDEVYKTHSANNVCRRVLFNLMNDLKKLRDE